MSNPKSRRAAVLAAHADLDRELKAASENGLALPRPVINELLEELGPERVAEALAAYNEQPTSRRSAAALKSRWGIRAGGSRWDAVASTAATVK
jgi:hypothetical protein